MFGLFSFGFPATAQAVSASSIFLSVAPENPNPYEEVTLTLNSYSNNLDTALINWFVNGKNTASQIGKKSFTTKVGANSSETVVNALISLPDGKVEKKVTLRPSTLTLLWQAEDSYVPPFYKGKALPLPDSKIKIVAVPEIRSGGNLINPKNMAYSWKKNYSNEQGASGYGKNSFVYNNDYLESSDTINVLATTVDQKYSTEGTIVVRPANSKILFYKKDNELGTLWEKAIGNNYRITQDEILLAVPYFISPKNPQNPILTWSWSINGSPVYLSGLTKNLIPLKVQSGVSGMSKLRVEIENKYKIFQTVSKEINIQF